MTPHPSPNWIGPFRDLYQAAVDRYRSGVHSSAEILRNRAEAELLDSLGLSKQVLFDYAEDGAQGGQPDYETVLLLTGLRRDFFWFVQKGVRSSIQIPEPQFPRKTDEIEGIPWLPRFILKAQCFLRGELPDELMYGCGGDRNFCKKHHLHLAEFLHFIWITGDSSEAPHAIVEWVHSRI